MADVVVEYRLNSREFARAEVTSKTRTGAQLVTFPVEMAIVPKGEDPLGQYEAAAWEASPGTNKAVARLIHDWDELGTFDVHVRWTDTPETPVKGAGFVKVKL